METLSWSEFYCFIIQKTSSFFIFTIYPHQFASLLFYQLEAFLIQNREEYLRHSALNYTAQQKKFNNNLTERILNLADQLGYVFDKEAFDFVTVRDRIRCYYKSYVQSSKKRGTFIGYSSLKSQKTRPASSDKQK